MRKEFRLREFKQMLKQLTGHALYTSFLERFKQENVKASYSNMDPIEAKKRLERSMQLTMRKFLPNNFTGSFTVMRQKIEKLVDDGFTF